VNNQNNSAIAQINPIRASEEQAFRLGHAKSYTTVDMDVSRETHAELKYLLEKAGYDHCIRPDGRIDLSGITLLPKARP